MKANHNIQQAQGKAAVAVSSYAKLLKWKQITTDAAASLDNVKL